MNCKWHETPETQRVTPYGRNKYEKKWKKIISVFIFPSGFFDSNAWIKASFEYPTCPFIERNRKPIDNFSIENYLHQNQKKKKKNVSKNENISHKIGLKFVLLWKCRRFEFALVLKWAFGFGWVFLYFRQRFFFFFIIHWLFFYFVPCCWIGFRSILFNIHCIRYVFRKWREGRSICFSWRHINFIA